MHYLSYFVPFFTTLFLAGAAAKPPHYLKLPLHRETPQQPPSLTLAADLRRISAVHRIRSHPKLPITSIAASGTGQYSVTLHLGTPPRRLRLVADTGSDLTWVSCSPTRHRSSAAYAPRASATFHPYHCYDPTCGLVPHPKHAPGCSHAPLHSSCPYEYKYADGSFTRGVFARETMTFNGTSGRGLISFKHLSFGCGFSNYGPSVSGHGFDGVLGLGRGPVSIASQLGRVFGQKFSYCLMDYTLSPPPTSYLIIGGNYVRNMKYRYTPLLHNRLSPTFYYIGIEGVFVNNVKVQINPSTWAIDESGNGGTVLDSGTTLTFLPEPAYRRILATFERLVMKLPRSSERGSGFDLCLNVSSGSRTILPRLSFKLGGGSIFRPPSSNYFINVAEDVMCLALQPVLSVNGFSIIGNLMQQGYTFEFDVGRSRVGFTRYGCAVL